MAGSIKTAIGRSTLPKPRRPLRTRRRRHGQPIRRHRHRPLQFQLQRRPRVSVPTPKSSLPEPKGPIDPKSVEAAGQVVQRYGALIEQKRWAEAKALWGDAGAAAAFQAQALSGNKENHIEIGELGVPEGAAGSTFVTMPVTFYGTAGDGHALPQATVDHSSSGE